MADINLKLETFKSVSCERRLTTATISAAFPRGQRMIGTAPDQQTSTDKEEAMSACSYVIETVKDKYMSV